MKRFFITFCMILTLCFTFYSVTYCNEVSDVITLNTGEGGSGNSGNTDNSGVSENNEYIDKSLQSGKEMLDVVDDLTEEYTQGIHAATQKQYSFTAKLAAFLGMAGYIAIVGGAAVLLLYTIYESFAIIAPFVRKFQPNQNTNNNHQQGLGTATNTGGNYSNFWTEDYLAAMKLAANANSNTNMNNGQLGQNGNNNQSMGTFSILKFYLINRFKLLVVCLIGVIVGISPVGINLLVGLGRIVFK